MDNDIINENIEDAEILDLADIEAGGDGCSIPPAGGGTGSGGYNKHINIEDDINFIDYAMALS